MLVLLMFSGVSIVYGLRGGGELFIMSFGFVLLVSVGLAWCVTDSRFVTMLDGWAGRSSNVLLSKVAEKFDGFQASIKKLGSDKSLLIKIFMYSVVFYMVGIVNVWTSALAFDTTVDLVDMVIAVPIIMLVMNLPVSIGGLGLMEASYTVGFEWLGYSAELGLTTALLMRAKTLIDGLVGAILELKATVRR